MCRSIVFSGLCLILSLAVAMATAEAAEQNLMTLHDIIENVRANEELYKNLEVSLEYSYQLEGEAAQEAQKLHGKKPQEGEFLVFETQKYRLHSVSQDGLFRADRTGAASSRGDSHTLDRVRAFDGTITRLYEQHSYANLIQGRSEDETFIRPHMFLLAMMQYFAPLSTYMSGHEAMRAYPGDHWDPSHTLEVIYRGEADFNGLKCHRVWVTTSVPGFGPYCRWELWLAEDRNYIPVRNLAYTCRFSRTEPVGEGVVEKWRELEPGIWFPVEVRNTAYNKWKLLKTGVRENQWTERYLTKDVSLHPQYDLGYFRDVSWPDGTPVYEVKQGKITSSYVKGAPESPRGPTADKALSRW